jgi:hypothetical protein
MSVRLDIIVQTHAAGNSQPGKTRYCGAPKSEVTRRCAISLVRSINRALPDVDPTLTVFDDHSGPEALSDLRETCSRLDCPWEVVQLETRGLMPSLRRCYEHGLRNARGQLVYFLQDDYLFSPPAIEEMVGAYLRFRAHLGGRELGIFPFDDPYRYTIPSNIELTRVVHGPKRHWRQVFAAPCTFMVSHDVVREHWDLFEAMASAPISPTMEDDTINKLWQQRKLFLFAPIPSLALHLQYETEKDPYIDWQSWWEEAKDRSLIDRERGPR